MPRPRCLPYCTIRTGNIHDDLLELAEQTGRVAGICDPVRTRLHEIALELLEFALEERHVAFGGGKLPGVAAIVSSTIC